MQEKIQSELRWTALDMKTKQTQLLAIKHYNQAQFRRLLEFVKECVRTRQTERAGPLVNHYFEFLDDGEAGNSSGRFQPCARTDSLRPRQDKSILFRKPSNGSAAR